MKKMYSLALQQRPWKMTAAFTTHHTASSPSKLFQFNNLVDSATRVDVKPFSCVPFTGSWAVTRSAVVRFVAIYIDHSASALIPATAEYFCDIDSPIAAFLESSHPEVEQRLFQAKCLTDKKVQETLQIRYDRKSIINTKYKHETVVPVMLSCLKCSTTKWTVTCINSGCSTEWYCQLVKLQNRRQSANFSVQFTFASVFSISNGNRSTWAEGTKCQCGNVFSGMLGKKPTSFFLIQATYSNIIQAFTTGHSAHQRCRKYWVSSSFVWLVLVLTKLAWRPWKTHLACRQKALLNICL